MAAIASFLASHPINLLLDSNLSPLFYLSKLNEPMFSFSFFFCFLVSFSLSFAFLLLPLYRKLQNKKQLQRKPERTQNDSSLLERSLAGIVDKAHQTREHDPTHMPNPLLLEILPPDSAEWRRLFGGEKRNDHDPDSVGSGQEAELLNSGGDQRVKKKKRRGKKKRMDLKGEESGEERSVDMEREASGRGIGHGAKPELVCLYPFTSTSSATQRKIKQQYDQLVKCHETKGLTLAQVGDFANCLIEARNELQHKSEVIKRKFTITKALLFKADRSSFDRLRQQIYKLEMEQKRLEEDAFVYNWLQQQLKLSPAYKKMLEIGARMEMNAKSVELTDSADSECSDISFEELLAQEKKDSFWQKNGRSRLSSSC